MFKQFATVNIDPSIKNNSDLHVVNVVFPPDEKSSDLLQNVSFYKSFIHDFRIETSDEKASLTDIFNSMAPIGSEIQNILVRYTSLPERATVGLESLPDFVESVHIISSSISMNDIERVKSMIGNTKLSIRLTGLIKTEILANPFMSVGKDYVLFSRLNSKNNSNKISIGENDALQYIFDRKKYD